MLLAKRLLTIFYRRVQESGMQILEKDRENSVEGKTSSSSSSCR